MFFSDICTLVNVIEAKNNYGATVTKSIEKIIFCNKKSIGMNENYELQRLGYKAELKLEVNLFEYSDEEFVIFYNKKYKIQRVYKRDDEIVELTCVRIAND